MIIIHWEALTMKSRIAVGILSFAIAVLALALGDCPNVTAEKVRSGTGQSAGNAPSNSSASVNLNKKSQNNTNTPNNLPTIFIGLDGKPIYVSEITAAMYTEKRRADITADDVGATVCCNRFTYLKEPTGVAFDSYNDPELFDGGRFIGEFPENTNEWKRVNVGDEICGLKVTKAACEFSVNDYLLFPERHFNYLGLSTGKPICEFEGTVSLEGFLEVSARDRYDLDGGSLYFDPTENKLPLMPRAVADDKRGYTTYSGNSSPYNFLDYHYKNEFFEIHFGNIRNAVCDMKGLDIGDVAYVRATFSNIKYYDVLSVRADLDNVEVLSVLGHIDDNFAPPMYTSGKD